MSDAAKLGLGKALYGEKFRDAIHVAIAPVTVTEDMPAGSPVRFVGENTEQVCKAEPDDAVGVIDPFLYSTAYKGGRFWLFLFPGTITSLRHDWTHPSFGQSTRQEAQAWVEAFAAELDYTYNRLMTAADLWVETASQWGSGEYEMDNSERYKDVHHSKWSIFWQHYETLRGKKPKHATSFFTCSC